MKKFNFTTVAGENFSFSIPEPAETNSFFLFSLPKAGSTLLMQIMADVCAIKNIPIVDLPTSIFDLGIPPKDLSVDINKLWQNRGYAYAGFRQFIPSMAFDLSSTKNILLVRDPRDMLVSLYFSMKYSHTVPDLQGKEHPILKQRKNLETVDINHAVLNMAHAYTKFFTEYMAKLPVSSTRVYRYEDIIFNKKEWLLDILEFLRIELLDWEIAEIAAKYDVRPQREDPKQHVRQVTPGNHKLHLSQETIEKLDKMFRPVMKNFHYDMVRSMPINSSSDERPCQNYTLFRDDSIHVHSKHLERDIEALRSSWSWRVTSPLRSIADCFIKKSTTK